MRQLQTPFRLSDRLPEFTKALMAKLVDMSMLDLAAQVAGAVPFSRCECGERDCATFDILSPTPEFTTSIEVLGLGGIVLVNVDARNRLVGIEILCGAIAEQLGETP